MAILIPSKNIYEINNPKIIDNALDKITVDTVKVEQVNEYDQTVYQETFTRMNVGTGGRDENFDSRFNRAETSGGGAHYYTFKYREAISYTRVTPYYSRAITVSIPKFISEDNKRILKIYSGNDADGFANIKHSVNYIKKVANASATCDAVMVNNEINSIQISIPSHETPTETNGTGEITTINTDTGAVFEKQGANMHFKKEVIIDDLKVISETIVGDETNLSTATVLENNDSFAVLELTVLTGVELYDLGYSYYKSITIPDDRAEYVLPTNPRTLTGTYTYYEPVSVDISIQGDIFRIDLKNTNLVNGNGQKPFSLSGNELLQETTNTNGVSTAQVLSDSVLTEYEHGKETATILCDINDYCQYRTEYENLKGELVITSAKTLPKDALVVGVDRSSADANGNEYRVFVERKLSEIQPYLYDIECSVTVKGKVFQYQGQLEPVETERTYTDVLLKTAETLYLNDDSKMASIDKITTNYFRPIVKSYVGGVPDKDYLKMSFDLHDIVIPMVMGSDGKDYPMSKNKDGSAKQFEVVGARKFYDGAVWQELTLQEYKTV